jgi:NADH-quinone oxidoreductase subunit M
MRRSSGSRFFAVLLVFAALFFIVLPARSAPEASGLRLRGPQRVLELLPGGNGMEASFFVENAGPKPLAIRARALTSDEDPRLPGGLTVTLETRAAAPRIDPGGAQRVQVRWAPGKMRELYGHVVIEAEGKEELRVGLHGEASAGPLAAFTRHLLSILLILPLLGALCVLGLHLLGRKNDRLLDRFVVAVLGTELAIAVFASGRFDPSVGRADGNEGAQLIERALLSSRPALTYSVGLDGASLSVLLGVLVIAFASALASRSVELRRKAFFGSMLVLVAGAVGVLAAQDLALLVLGWSLLAAGLWGVVQASLTSRLVPAAFGAWLAGGVLLLAVSAYALASRAGTVLLPDGTQTYGSFSFLDVVRAELTTSSPFLGGPAAAVVLVLTVLAMAPFVALFPAGGWLDDALDDLPPAGAALVVGIVPAVAGYTLVRIDVMLISEGTRWAATTLSILGATAALVSAAKLLSERRLRRIAGSLSGIHAGLVLLGIGTLTVQGIEGALVQCVVQALGTGALAYVASLVAARCSSETIGGLAEDAPFLSAALACSLASSACIPGLFGFWGAFLSLAGAIPLAPFAAALLVIALVTTAVASTRVVLSAVGGQVPDVVRKSSALEPFGGKVPDLFRHERTITAALCALLLILGVWPRPVLRLVDHAALDLAAFVNPPGVAQVAKVEPASSPTGELAGIVPPP